ncbi:MAG: hypothetical protein ABSH48_02355 [Verrucomicrobiota bacterium]|jgi:hypothetical protein
MQRSSLNRIPGRLAFNSISLYSKGGTTIDTDLVYSQEEVAAAGLGKIDNRDKEAYDEITLTPDGRMTTAIAAVLWPYSNPTLGAGIFPATDVPAAVHGNDSSLDTHPAAALVQMPQMIFHPVKTLVGQMKLLCLRSTSSGAVNPWSTAGSLRTFASTGGTFTDTTFSSASPITQDYQLTWGSVTGWSGLDFYDGLVFEPKVEFVDDNVASVGLFNKRIKSVGGMLRGIPVGLTRTMIDTQLQIQGTGAVRGASGAAKAYSVTVTGADTKVYLAFTLGQLIKSKLQNGVEQLREGEVAWECLPTITSGVRGAYWTNAIA